MKSIILLLAIAISSTSVSVAQSIQLLTGDSVRIELERKAISTELSQLSDSIQISILTFTSHISKSSPSKKENRLVTGRKQLTDFHNQLALDLKEISTTGQNYWNSHSVERIRLATSATRREYKRILTLL